MSDAADRGARAGVARPNSRSPSTHAPRAPSKTTRSAVTTPTGAGRCSGTGDRCAGSGRTLGTRSGLQTAEDSRATPRSPLQSCGSRRTHERVLALLRHSMHGLQSAHCAGGRVHLVPRSRGSAPVWHRVVCPRPGPTAPRARRRPAHRRCANERCVTPLVHATARGGPQRSGARSQSPTLGASTHGTPDSGAGKTTRKEYLRGAAPARAVSWPGVARTTRMCIPPA